MSEPVTDQQPDASPEETPDAAPELDVERATKKINKLNSEAANLRARLKELEPIAAKAKELEDAQKSEAQKLTERAELAERSASEAQREMSRLRVLSEISLPADLHEFVIGDTEDEMRAKAQKLQGQFAAERGAVDVGLGPRRTGISAANPAEEFASILRNQLGT